MIYCFWSAILPDTPVHSLDGDVAGDGEAVAAQETIEGLGEGWVDAVVQAAAAATLLHPNHAVNWCSGTTQQNYYHISSVQCPGRGAIVAGLHLPPPGPAHLAAKLFNF